MGSPVEGEVVVPEAIRPAVERWLAHADKVRAAGVHVPTVGRADLVKLADGVPPEFFAEAVRHHVEESDACYWRAPLKLLALRVEWQFDKLAKVAPTRAEPPSAAPSPPSPTPRGHSLSPPRVVDALLTIPDDEWAADWTQALARLRDVVEPWDVVHWLEPLDGRSVTVDGEPALIAPDASHARWVEEHFGGQIEAALGYRPRFATPEYTASGEGACPPEGRPELSRDPPVWAAADMPAPPRRTPGREGAAAPAHLARGGGDVAHA